MKHQKKEFYDLKALCYRWNLNYLHSLCACGKLFTVDHVMPFTKGGCVHKRHDKMRDLLAKITTEILSDVEFKPYCHKPTGKQLPAANTNTKNEAILDLSICGFWQRGKQTFFYMRICNPFALLSNRNQKLHIVFKSIEARRKYARVLLEIKHGTF